MIEIDDKIVSTDILTTPFLCDIRKCKGICCVEGNAGAPLEMDEVDTLEQEFEAYRKYMKPEGVEAVERDGFMVIDSDGDYTTPLINDCECAYSYQEGGVTLCAIERAYKSGETTFVKPISCHLYPIRLTTFSNGTIGLNYHRWAVCSSALECGQDLGVPMFQMLKEPIIRRFGAEFFDALVAAHEYIGQTEQENEPLKL